MKKEIKPITAVIVIALVGGVIWGLTAFVFTGKTKGVDFMGIEKKK